MFQKKMTKNEVRITLKKIYLKPCLYFTEVNELVSLRSKQPIMLLENVSYLSMA